MKAIMNIEDIHDFIQGNQTVVFTVLDDKNAR
jgi:hypothetical protein